MFKATPHLSSVPHERSRSRLSRACLAFAGALRRPDNGASAADLHAARLAHQRAEDELVMVAAAHVAKVAPLPSAGL
jgi:hypothetical protein